MKICAIIGGYVTECQMVELRDRFDTVVVRAHQKAGRQNGEPVEATLTDPKYIYEGGIRYKHHKRLDWMPEDHPGFDTPLG
jgi:hypothetical protein